MDRSHVLITAQSGPDAAIPFDFGRHQDGPDAILKLGIEEIVRPDAEVNDATLIRKKIPQAVFPVDHRDGEIMGSGTCDLSSLLVCNRESDIKSAAQSRHEIVERSTLH
ncbi:hypothetical protein ACQ86G_26405 [Roseateles chitinivorans]|uniref:hypothetical protein n=1 Tax=Roseateles chitinivorans TaxID=2917965 RepID=UPI003D676CDB